MNKLKRAGNKFKYLYIGSHAVVTNTVTAGAMGCLADTIAQTLEIKFAADNQSRDYSRTKNMTIVATAFGPLLYYWYGFLDRRFPGKSRRSLISKVALDVVISPVYYGLFLGGLFALKNSSFEGSLEEYKEKAPLLIGADIVLWPVFQLFNFMVFPPYYRIIGLKLNEILMGMLTSHLVNKDYGIHKLEEKCLEYWNSRK